MKIAILFFSVVILSGCAGGYNVRVSSMAGPEAQTKRIFKVAPGDIEVDENSLLFRSLAGQVEMALESKGFTKWAPNPNGVFPEILVMLRYAVSDPETVTSTIAMPTWGQTGVSASNTYGSVSSYGSFSATTTYTPTYGVTGYVPVTSSDTYFVRSASIAAYGFPPPSDGKPVELWRTTAVSVGPTGDIRTVFPYLLKAALPYLGEDSGKERKVYVPSID